MLSHSKLVGEVWDDELKKLALYKELINHQNKIIHKRWIKGGENKFWHSFEGFSPNGIDGLSILQWIEKHQVPADKTVTYPQYTAAL